jgi:hypothetical protein
MNCADDIGRVFSVLVALGYQSDFKKSFNLDLA